MKKAVIFGVGKNFERRKAYYKNNYDIVGFIDNRRAGEIVKYNTKIGGGVKNPSAINSFDYDVIIITPSYYTEMKKQLIDLGVSDDKIVIDVFLSYTDKDTAERSIMGIKSYSQHGEDLIIAAIFLQLGVDKPTYMDLGANSPFIGSNTALMYESGCHGINVDASPDCIELFKHCRSKDINLNIGVAKQKGELPFYFTSELSGRNSFKKEAFNNSNKKVNTMMIPVVTLDDIVTKYCNGVFPDFLDCDIEGLDYEVLSSCNLRKRGPKVICVECALHESELFDDMLKEKGYFKYCRIGVNNIYIKDDFKFILWE